MAIKIRFKEGPFDDKITINKIDYKVKYGTVYHSQLLFWDENPRTYTSLSNQTSSQDDIYDHLKNLNHVRDLKTDISGNGGVTDPLIVRGDNGVVIEGNRRLACLRILQETTGKSLWDTVKVYVFPENTPEDAYFSIVGTYHIKGKKQWTPFEQAGYIYRRSQIPGVTAKIISNELGMTESLCRHLIKTYGYMQKQGFNDTNRWSFFDEILKSKHVSKLKKIHPKIEKVINDQIKSGKIKKADDIRKKLGPLIKASKSVVKKFVEEKISLDEAHDLNETTGNLDVVYQRFVRFRRFINEPATKSEIKASKGELRTKLNYELNKISKLSKNLTGLIK